jgi:hypothetical protein
MKKLTSLTCVSVALTVCGAIAASASGQTVIGPYELKVFANAPSGLSAPDSIAVLGGHVFVGYGDGHLPDGSDGLNSQVVEFSKDGVVLHTYTVPGHNDGLKVNPRTHELWAIQNEDANANLVIINAETHDQKLYTFGPTLHGGGYDDLVFIGRKVYVSASNPAKNPNTGPAIVSAKLVGNTVQVEPVLAGTASAIDIPSDAVVNLNLQDPDSMTLDPEGDIVLDSQGDDELIIVTNPGTSAQQVSHLPLTQRTAAGLVPVEVDDTAFTTLHRGGDPVRGQELEYGLYPEKESVCAWRGLHGCRWRPIRRHHRPNHRNNHSGGHGIRQSRRHGVRRYFEAGYGRRLPR